MKLIKPMAMVIFFSGLCGLSAQQELTAPAAAQSQAAIDMDRLRLATSTLDYPVTPGDTYQLSYHMTDTIILLNVTVESDYTLDLKVFGRISAAGQTFSQVKKTIEDKIAAGYPRSLPSVSIASTGIFRVYIRGEITLSRYVTAWGLSRLSEIIENVRAPYSSIRSVQIFSPGSDVKQYDLMDAFRFGQPAQDPLVKPGDVIVLSRADRIVEVSGAVFQPGRYELEPGEGLRELVNRYGGGTTTEADLSSVRIERIAGARPSVSYVSLPAGFDSDSRLLDGDRIIIASKAERLPFAFFEGAVIPTTAPAEETPGAIGAAAAAETAAAAAQSRLLYPFRDGETLSAAYRSVQGSIASYADVSAAALIRGTEIRAVNLLTLGSSSSAPDIVLEANDRIIIPILRLFVSVQGAVFSPANYPYQAGSTAQAYISLAGGTDPERSNGSFTLADAEGRKKKATDNVLPGDKIYVPANRFGYVMNRAIPVITSILTLVVTSTTLAIQIDAFINR